MESRWRIPNLYITIVSVYLIIGAIALSTIPSIPLAEGNGRPCEMPKNLDEIKTNYEKLSNSILKDWILERVYVGCFGSIQAWYLLPEFSSENTRYIVAFDAGYASWAVNDTFSDDFIKNHSKSVADSVAKIKSNELFKEIDNKFTYKNVTFSYGTYYPYVLAYNEFKTCSANFEIDPINKELIFCNVTNDVEIETITAVQLARKYALQYLESFGYSCRLKEVSESSCGRTEVGTGYMVDQRGITPMSYSAEIDLEGSGCPGKVGVVMDPNLKPIIISVHKQQLNVIFNQKDRMTLLDIKNLGDEPIFKLKIKVGEGKIKFVKAKEWDRDRLEENSVLVETSDRPIVKNDSQVIRLITDTRFSSYELTAFDRNNELLWSTAFHAPNVT